MVGNLLLHHGGVIVNKFRIYNIQHIRCRKRCQLPGWMKNSSCYNDTDGDSNHRPPTQNMTTSKKVTRSQPLGHRGDLNQTQNMFGKHFISLLVDLNPTRIINSIVLINSFKYRDQNGTKQLGYRFAPFGSVPPGMNKYQLERYLRAHFLFRKLATTWGLVSIKQLSHHSRQDSRFLSINDAKWRTK